MLSGITTTKIIEKGKKFPAWKKISMSDLMKTTYDKYVLQLYHFADHLSLLVKRFTQFLKVRDS